MITERALNITDSSEVPAPTHFLWIDDDMTFEPDAAKRLLELDLPIVGGLCFGRRSPYPPILLYKSTVEHQGYLYRYEYPEGLVEVEATGAAFLLVKKEVFLRIHEKFKEGPWSNRGWGEDVSFCERAREVGVKTVVDTRVKIGHVGEVTIEAGWARKNRTIEVNPWEPPTDVPSGAPQATIVIPTYNQKSEWLRAAVESALAQTVPVEVIVVNDGGTDAVPRILGELAEKVKYVYISHRGCFAALNAGIRAMTTEWFSWLSSDDTFYPRKIARQIRAMKSVGVRASFHAYDVLFSEEAGEAMGRRIIMPANWHTMEEQQRVLSQGCAINGLTAMIHKSVLDETGAFDESFKIASDYELWYRIAQHTMWQPIPEILATRREHSGNYSMRYANDPEQRARWIEEDKLIRAMYGLKCAKCSSAL
jgi:GT2 family glycosyltransferase